MPQYQCMRKRTPWCAGIMEALYLFPFKQILDMTKAAASCAAAFAPSFCLIQASGLRMQSFPLEAWTPYIPLKAQHPTACPSSNCRRVWLVIPYRCALPLPPWEAGCGESAAPVAILSGAVRGFPRWCAGYPPRIPALPDASRGNADAPG